MIEQIDIPNFGSFQNFVWNDAVRDEAGHVVRFKKLNILYGRNYSGKTTLSRIFRSLQTGLLPEKYDTPSYVVSTQSGIFNESAIPLISQNIRVYNKDFVDEHLSFLRDSQGHVTPFAIIGSENKSIENAIAEKEKELGSVEGKTGLRYAHSAESASLAAQQSAATTAEGDLRAKLTNKATQPPTGIKHNPLYKDPNYNTPKILADIAKIKSERIAILSEKDRREKEVLLNATALLDIEQKVEFAPRLSTLLSSGATLLSKRIAPAEPIQELLDDAALQLWVKDGISHHKGKRDKCGFCGQTLPASLWKKLDEHFSKESSDLEIALRDQISAVETERENLNSIFTVDVEAFYAILRPSFIEARSGLTREVARYDAALGSLAHSLRDRLADIFHPRPLPELADNSLQVSTQLSVLDHLIEQNNKKTESLEIDKAIARVDLRLSEVAQFIHDIGLENEEKRIAELQREVTRLNSSVSKLRSDILTLEKEIDALRVQLKDEKKGAQKVNEYLNHYFGHQGLRLVAIGDADSSAFKFQILRGTTPAYNLSEGECSLVSFCYFIAKLEDADSKGKKLLV